MNNNTVIRLAKDSKPGIATFYVQSESQPEKEYSVKIIRRGGMRRAVCDCPDFFHRRQVVRRHCKHLHLVLNLIRSAHGIANLRGVILSASQKRGGSDA